MRKLKDRSYSAAMVGWHVNPETAKYGMAERTTLTPYVNVQLN